MGGGGWGAPLDASPYNFGVAPYPLTAKILGPLTCPLQKIFSRFHQKISKSIKFRKNREILLKYVKFWTFFWRKIVKKGRKKTRFWTLQKKISPPPTFCRPLTMPPLQLSKRACKGKPRLPKVRVGVGMPPMWSRFSHRDRYRDLKNETETLYGRKMAKNGPKNDQKRPKFAKF